MLITNCGKLRGSVNDNPMKNKVSGLRPCGSGRGEWIGTTNLLAPNHSSKKSKLLNWLGFPLCSPLANCATICATPANHFSLQEQEGSQHILRSPESPDGS